MKKVLRRVGIDWGSEAHQVCRIDGEGKPTQRAFPHTSEGLRALVAFVVEGNLEAEQIAIAIEVNHGAVVEALLAKGLRVYSTNPKVLDRLRDRFFPAGAKDDRRDAFVLASCVVSDAHAFRRIEPAGQLQQPARRVALQEDNCLIARRRSGRAHAGGHQNEGLGVDPAQLRHLLGGADRPADPSGHRH